MARFWKTNASISMPAPAIAHAMSEPRMPVATPKRAGSENTPAPTMLPTTMPVKVGRLILPGSVTWVPPSGATGVGAIEGAATEGTVSAMVGSLPWDR